MAEAAGLPRAIGDWRLRQIPSGVWLSSRTGQVPVAVLGLVQEPGRLALVVDAESPGEQTDRVLGELFSSLSRSGLTSVRLVLPFGADRYGPAASGAYGLDVMAVDGPLTVTPHGYALAMSDGADERWDLPQWWRFLPGGEAIPAGLLSPSPPWERELAGLPELVAPGVAVHRVPAGLALYLPDASPGQIAAAHAVWPDPERITIVADGTGAQGDVLYDALASVLLLVPGAVAHGVRLWWPRAGADPASPALHELARLGGVELIAPSADVSVVDGSCGLCHGPVGVAPWVRFTGNPPGQPMEALYPVPGWQRALDQADLTGLAAGLAAERVTAGLCVYRRESAEPGRASRGLAATARSVIPDPVRAMIIAAGDAGSPAARRDLEAVLDRLPAEATQSLRIVLSGAGAGGAQSYAQILANTMGSHIIAPGGVWTATPDGRLRAVAADQTPGADGWQELFPRHPRGAAPTDQAGGDIALPPDPPATPASPATTASPATPANHASHTTPVSPATHASTANPATPANLASTVTTASPVTTASHTNAAATASHTNAAATDNLATHATPDNPATPAAPDNLATPASPATPDNPASPATRANTANPVVLDNPDNSDNLASPADPASPATPDSPANSATPANPARPATPHNPASPANTAAPAIPPANLD